MFSAAHLILSPFNSWTQMERVMAEFLRSSAIILMGIAVIAAGVLVVFYG